MYQSIASVPSSKTKARIHDNRIYENIHSSHSFLRVAVSVHHPWLIVVVMVAVVWIVAIPLELVLISVLPQLVFQQQDIVHRLSQNRSF